MVIKKGDHVFVCATAKVVNESLVRQGVEMLRAWGLEVLVAPQVFETSGYFAGSDAKRRDALQAAINDPIYKAIWFARGGYGTTRIIDELNFSPLLVYPKIFIGFSDLTSIHQALQALGHGFIHGPMVQHLPQLEESNLAQVKMLLFENTFQLKWKAPFFQSGQVQAALAGGNLKMITHGIGSKYPPDFSGKILVIEEVGESIYAIDRMMNQIQRAGLLQGIRGCLIGQFSQVEDTDPAYGAGVEEVLQSYLRPLGVPYAFGLASGHDFPNYALPFGAMVQVNIDDKGQVDLRGL